MFHYSYFLLLQFYTLWQTGKRRKALSSEGLVPWAGARHTHILVLAVEVSQSAASPTISSPVESWLKYLGCARIWKNGRTLMTEL